jgi:hypothetical protein
VSARVLVVTVEGQRYEIPEMWLAGATRTRTIGEAVQLWHQQAMLEEVFRHQREAA